MLHVYFIYYNNLILLYLISWCKYKYYWCKYCKPITLVVESQINKKIKIII